MRKSIRKMKAMTQGLQALGVSLRAVWNALDVRDITRLPNFMKQW